MDPEDAVELGLVPRNMSEAGKTSPVIINDLEDKQTAGGTSKATQSKSDGRKESVEGSAYQHEKGTGFSELIFEKEGVNASSVKETGESKSVNVGIKADSSSRFQLGIDLMGSASKESES